MLGTIPTAGQIQPRSCGPNAGTSASPVSNRADRACLSRILPELRVHPLQRSRAYSYLASGGSNFRRQRRHRLWRVNLHSQDRSFRFRGRTIGTPSSIFTRSLGCLVGSLSIASTARCRASRRLTSDNRPHRGDGRHCRALQRLGGAGSRRAGRSALVPKSTVVRTDETVSLRTRRRRASSRTNSDPPVALPRPPPYTAPHVTAH